MMRKIQVGQIALLAAVLSLIPLQSSAAQASEEEQPLIKVLQSDAPPSEKAITCKKLAVYGSKEAVPALAPLLLDRELTSWARIALEVIPDPAAAEALRNAAGKAQGRMLVGIINSIGVRRDPQAVGALVDKLQDADAEVGAAAAEALGHIGGDTAAQALTQALSSSQERVKSSAAYGAVLCAEQWLAEGKAAEAAALCDRVRQANVPKQRALEATRGAILARQSKGIPLLVETLRSPDLGLFSIGVRTARELPGRDVTQAVAAELDQANPERQVPLLLALSDRTDSSVLPKLLQVAEGGAKQTRLTALSLLDRFQDLVCVPALLNGATDNDPDLARTAKAGLARLGGKEVDADLLARLRLASGKTRQVLIDLAGQRRIQAAVPVIMRSTEDSNSAIRRAALEAISVLGTEQQAGDVIRLLSSTQNADDREDIERALSGICRRSGTACLPQVLPLARTGDAAQRKVGLRALSSIGGTEALSVVKTAVNDQDPVIQDEAVNLLATWPNTWPEDDAVAEPLLTLAKTGKKPAYRVQGLRGYLQYLEENKKLNSNDKVAKIKELLPSVQGPEEKRQVISVLGTIPAPSALELLNTLAADQAVAEEAYMATVKVAADRGMRNASRELRRSSLETVVANSKEEATRKKAADELRRIR